MKSRIGIQLSEQVGARLEAAAKRQSASKSALVEAALNRFLESDEQEGDSVTLAEQLSQLGGQVAALHRELKIVGEIVAHHARFHLAIAPVLTDEAGALACSRGSERFEEFANQVHRRFQFGSSLLQETVDRRRAAPLSSFEESLKQETFKPPVHGEASNASSSDDVRDPNSFAAGQGAGSKLNFPGQIGNLRH